MKEPDSPRHLNDDGVTGIQIREGAIARWLGPVLGILVLSVALWFLHRELNALSPEAIVRQIRSVSWMTLFAAFTCTAGSYTVLTLYDILALRYLNREIPILSAAVTAFMAFAVGHNVGLGALSGGTVRYRMYSLLGLSSSDIARVIVFVAMTFFLGGSLLLGVAISLMPAEKSAIIHLPSPVLHITGGILVMLPLVYVATTLFLRRPFELGNWQVRPPRLSISLGQLAVSMADLVLACATLYVLLAPHLEMGPVSFLGVYLLAVGAGIISSLPGGLGVFEAVLFAALPQVDRGILLATILLYRLLYYVVPLVLALLLLSGHELHLHRHLLRRTTTVALTWVAGIAPQLAGMAVFLAGVVLLVSGATPAVTSRLSFIAEAIPLPLLELSHLSGSVVGVALLVLAGGLYQRLHGAYLGAMALLGVGSMLSLLKGLDYEEATLLLVVMFLLWLCREEFYRVRGLLSQTFSLRWGTAIVVVLIAIVWTGIVSFRHVEYSDELWWQFARDAQAPRMLRASLVASVTALAFGLLKLLRTSPIRPPGGNDSDPRQLDLVLASARDPAANLARLGDKRFLWSADGSAFIMYQVSGRSWIAMGEPVGPQEKHEELAWSFREMVDRYGGRPVFYQVSDTSLPLYVDMGLALAKLGEDGRVDLSRFSLEGSRYGELRRARNKAIREGARFEVVPRHRLAAITVDLRAVSDEWLADRGVAEKGFSLGAFSEAYIEQFDCAIVRVGSCIVAFANLWPAPAGGELSIDLMRHTGKSPHGIMDYLFTELMLWGQAQNYRWFSLGMAPLSGLEQRSLAPLWHKLGHMVFTHGEYFYNFEGLRQYKEKFDPEWRPRYIACPGGLVNLPRALIDTAHLISGSWSGLVGR